MIVILTGLFVSTASNLNSYAHTKLGMPSSNTISMVSYSLPEALIV